MGAQKRGDARGLDVGCDALVLLHVRPLIVAFEWHLCAQLPMEVPDLSKMNLQRTFVCVGPLCLRSGVGLMAGIGCGAGLGE